jgi:predicted transposase/invertase (TIGR01784 family)
MDHTPLSPKYDVVFKNIFNEKHLHVLIDFLKSVLDLSEDDYQEIRLMDPHLLRRYKKDKLGILDLRISTKSGHKIDVELQIEPQPSIWKRVLRRETPDRPDGRRRGL